MGGYISIDPGTTVVDENGRALLSPNAIRLPKPPDLNAVAPNLSQVPPNNIPQNIQSAAPPLQGQEPKYSIPSDMQRDIYSQMPQRNDPNLQPSKLRHILNVIAGYSGGLGAGTEGKQAPTVKDLDAKPYDRATQDWQNKMKGIEPLVRTQETENRQRSEDQRSQATLKSTDAYRQATEEDRKVREQQIDRQRQDQEDKEAARESEARIEAKRKEKRDQLTEQLKLQAEKIAANKIPIQDEAYQIYAKQSRGEKLSPEEQSKLQAFHKIQQETKTDPGIARMLALGSTRGVSMLDTKNNNSPVELNWDQINQFNKTDPGRFMPVGSATPALKSEALIGDIRGNVGQVRSALDALPEDFGKLDRAKIAFALRSNNPSEAVSHLISSGAVSNLSPQQQEYVIAVTNLVENSLSMRTLLGVGQGSRDLRAAIEAVIPGPMTPSKTYAKKQLEYFEKTLGRLEAGVPKVPLRSDTGPQVNKPKGKILKEEDVP